MAVPNYNLIARGAVAVLVWLLAAGMVRAAEEGPFQFAQSELMKAAPRAVFVAFMGDYRTPAVAGRWSAWDYGSKSHSHNPDHLDAAGKRDIASCFYPAIGPYDMSDPDAVEYHCQLLKMAGVDGISFNLAFFQRDPWRQKSMKLYVQTMQRYGLKGLVRFENKFYAKTYSSHAEALAAAYADMDAWMTLFEPIQYRIGTRPVFTLFTFSLSPDELKTWKDSHPEEDRPVIVTYGANAKYQGVVDGRFGWTGDHPNSEADHPPYRSDVTAALAQENEQYDRQRAADLLRSGQISFYMAGVSPGFDSIGCWGWGGGPRKVERDDGRVYQYRWEKTLQTDLPVVLIATWNDWNEGTPIEPAVEYGDQYLAMTRKYVARFKSKTEPSGNLLVPVWIYKVRKTTSETGALKDMAAASEAIVAGDYAKAESLARPWAAKLGVEKVEAWDQAGAVGHGK